MYSLLTVSSTQNWVVFPKGWFTDMQEQKITKWVQSTLGTGNFSFVMRTRMRGSSHSLLGTVEKHVHHRKGWQRGIQTFNDLITEHYFAVKAINETRRARWPPGVNQRWIRPHGSAREHLSKVLRNPNKQRLRLYPQPLQTRKSFKDAQQRLKISLELRHR